MSVEQQFAPQIIIPLPFCRLKRTVLYFFFNNHGCIFIHVALFLGVLVEAFLEGLEVALDWQVGLVQVLEPEVRIALAILSLNRWWLFWTWRRLWKYV